MMMLKMLNIVTKSFLLMMAMFCIGCGNSDIASRIERQETSMLEEMLNWKFNPEMAPAYNKSKQETEFSIEIQKISEKNNVKLCYYLYSLDYFLVHMLPLFHVLPAPFCAVAGNNVPKNVVKRLLDRGYKREAIFLFPEEAGFPGVYLKSSNNLIITDQELWKDAPGNVFTVKHGVDEDRLYFEHKLLTSTPVTPALNLVFTRFNEEVNSNNLDKIKKFYQIDPSRKTVFYASTIGEMEFMDPTSPVQEKMFLQLRQLKNKYNVIIRLHPIFDEVTKNKISEDFLIAPFVDFPSFVPFYDLVDVIIGPPSSVTTAATSRSHLPILLLRPTISWDRKTNVSEVANKNKNIVLGEATTIVQDETCLDLEHGVEKALAGSQSDKIEARQKYFKYWFGCVDGYEEYRVLIRIFETRGLNASHLKKIYNSFDLYKNKPLCLYEVER
ncbi:MAG: hypothetical protein WCK42_02295 [Myxococcaceae bacterium]